MHLIVTSMKIKFKIRSIIIISTLLMFGCLKSNAQQEKYYAAFIYQFTKYVNWSSQSTSFIIAVVGNTSATATLKEISKEKKVGSNPISLVEWNSPNDIGNCNVLFVPASQKANLSAIINKAGSKPILIVTESSGTISSGADISFQKNEGKIQFELNKTNLQKKGLTVSTDLERLAAKVY